MEYVSLKSSAARWNVCCWMMMMMMISSKSEQNRSSRISPIYSVRQLLGYCRGEDWRIGIKCRTQNHQLEIIINKKKTIVHIEKKLRTLCSLCHHLPSSVCISVILYDSSRFLKNICEYVVLVVELTIFQVLSHINSFFSLSIYT